jgi:(1->4)-alpha-D-glucan 1-alpha-D-glucosylmutase
MLSSAARIPIATYRVQMTADFSFDAAGEIMDYLARLGISHLYASPYLQAGKGSTHGYDVVNHKRMNIELGGEQAHRRFCDNLSRCGLGQVLDIVPNHMAIGSEENDLWWDVLENGPASRYATFFDIDWQAPESKLHGKVLLPVLGEHYGPAVEKGDLQVRRNGGVFTVHYYEHASPLAPESLSEVLSLAGQRAGSDHLLFLVDSLARLPVQPDPESVQRRHRFKTILLQQLDRLLAENATAAAAVDGAIGEINSDPDAMDRLLGLQHYRLAYWRIAGRELNYRRFFNIDTLAGIAIENENVFNETHGLLLRWMNEGCLDGLRIDHVDGLRNPREYLERLRAAAPKLWIVVEKILEPGENLPRDWPVAGTTGYDFLNQVGALFVDPQGEEAITSLYAEFTNATTPYHHLVRRKKHLMLREAFGGELSRLTNMLVAITERHRAYRDYSRHELHEALRELIVCLPVYRTYMRARDRAVSEQDVACLEQAITEARKYRPDLDPGLWQFLRDLLLLCATGSLSARADNGGQAASGAKQEGPGDLEGDFVMRFQQVTGPVMAKGVEDTAFYCYNRLISLNEVGGDPGVFGMPVDEFHRLCVERQQRWPNSMLSTSTHDTKRGEDTRLRISLLSEIPDRWADAVRRWSGMNQKHRRHGKPDPNDEYMLYQTLVGTWPIDVARLTEFALKAVREAKVHTNWVFPNARYEEAITGFATAILESPEFVQDLERFLAPLRRPAYITSLSQTLIKYTAPGVPDLYQGTELWDLSLVDPDNRRPVNYPHRRAMLERAEAIQDSAQLRDCLNSGLAKMFLIHRALKLRRARLECFGPAGVYGPLAARGDKASHLVAYTRGSTVAVVAPRLLVKLAGDWGNTQIPLPPGQWRNVFTDQVSGGDAAVGELLRDFPVGLLERTGEQP